MNAQSIPVVAMASISLYVGFYHLLIYFRRRQHREDLTFALLCLATCLYDVFCIGLYNSSTVAEGVQWQRAQFVALALVTTAFMWFVSDYTHQKPGIVLYAFSAFYLLAIFVQVVDRSNLTWLIDSHSIKEVLLPLGIQITYYEATFGPFTTVQSLMGLTASTYIVVSGIRFYRSGHKREAVPLLLALGFMYAAAFNDTAVSNGLYQFIYAIEYGYMAMILLMTYSLSNTVVESAVAKEAWRASEERFRTLVETTSDWVWETDPNGVYTYVSPKVRELLGYEPQEIIGKTPFDLMPSDEAQRISAIFLEAARGPKPFERIENITRCKDGRLVVLETSGVPFFDANGKPLGYRGIDRDITERKHAEEALRESEQRFRLFMQHFPGLAYIKDAATRILFANQGFMDYLKIAPAATLGKTNQDIFPAEFAEQITADDRRVLESGASEVLEEHYAGRVWSTYKFVIPQADKPSLLGGFTLDVTERKRTEETLQMFQYTIDRASDAVQWLNREAGFEYVNDQACRSLGYTREELMRLHLWDIDPIYPKERWEQNWESYQDGRVGGGENVETLHRRKDGSVFPVEVSSNHLWFGDRELHVAVVRDITERKQAEEALRRTQFVVDRAKDAIHWLDADGKLVYVNDSICRSLGYTRGELLTMTVFDIDPVFPKETWPDHWRKMSELGSYMFETVHRAKDGHTFPVEVSIDVMRFGGKEFHSVYTRDITERKQTEQILQLRLRVMEFAATHSLEELLQKTLDEVGELTNSPIGFYHFVEADQRTLSLQAWSTRTLDEFCQAEGKGLHYPIDQAGVWTDCVRERRPVIHNDYQALPHRKGLPEGHAQVMRELVVPILRGDYIVAILGVGNKAQAYTEKDVEAVSYAADVAWEITERKRAEEASVKLAKFPSENPYPVLRLDRDGMVLYANKASLGLLADWGSAEGERAPEFWREVVTEALMTQAMRTVETKSGGQIYSVSVVPIVDANYVNLYGSNITERKQAEAQREELIRELEAKNAELERFTYTVSHDLKAPLITMRGFLGFLEKDAEAGNVERMQADMKRVSEATDKMQRLLNELLELSRIGRIMNLPEAVPFETIAQEAIELVQGRLEAHRVRVDIAPDLPTVYGDRARLVEVMQNLMDNAAKFTGDQVEPQITIGQQGFDRDGKPIFFVRDNGLGIDPQYHDRVFGLFDKLDPRSEGTGVGLALVKRIVEVHDGRIWIESETGKGSTFLFTLPGSPE